MSIHLLDPALVVHQLPFNCLIRENIFCVYVCQLIRYSLFDICRYIIRMHKFVEVKHEFCGIVYLLSNTNYIFIPRLPQYYVSELNGCLIRILDKIVR